MRLPEEAVRVPEKAMRLTEEATVFLKVYCSMGIQ
jgi:hypothetical protein